MSMPEELIYLLFKESLTEKKNNIKITAPMTKLDLSELPLTFRFTNNMLE